MTKEEYKEKLNKLLGDMDTLDDAYGYYDNDEFDFDYIMQLHDIADDALDLAEEAEELIRNSSINANGAYPTILISWLEKKRPANRKTSVSR